ncbi:unnamed protein product, partial [Musa banksii]
MDILRRDTLLPLPLLFLLLLLFFSFLPFFSPTSHTPSPLFPLQETEVSQPLLLLPLPLLFLLLLLLLFERPTSPLFPPAGNRGAAALAAATSRSSPSSLSFPSSSPSFLLLFPFPPQPH